ncbi:MAG TPA: glycosyltransferase family 39 protein, partial [Thermomicrobiaceae bacterium]|nr:glycosyltransferase family 39 protein [Thermomicrobiaceae bacterium]
MSVEVNPSPAARRVPARLPLLLVGLALADVAGHLLVGGNYGYFRDELYYIAAGHHLAFGYVDFPPMIALLAALLGRLAGDSLIAIHVVPALGAGALVIVAGLIARELGGGRTAMLLAGLATAVAVVFLATGSLFSMDVLDEIWWALAAYLVVRRIRRDEPRTWLWIGLVVGVALATKLTVLFLCFGLVVGLLLTPPRRDLGTRWPWLAGVLAAAFLAPYVVWNAVNGWPTLDFWLHSGVRGGGGPVSFLANQIVALNPLTLPLTVAGLLFYFRAPAGKPYRALGWAFVATYLLLTVLNGKPYYFAPAFPMVFAAGGCLLEGIRRRWVLPVYGAALAVSGALLAPLAMPVLPPASFV